MTEEVLVVFTTWPDAAAARTAGRILVEEKLAACANIVPGVESMYRWKETVETSFEVLMILKTTIGRYPMLETRVRELHSYELPEVIAFRVADGLPAYLRWVEENAR